MNDWLFAVLIAIFFIGSLALSRFYYYLGLKKKTATILDRLQLNWSELHYSLDHLVYFIPLPCHHPQLKTIGRNDLYVKKEFASFLFPSVSSLRIFAKTKDGEQLIAFLAVDKLGFPQLTEFLWNGSLSAEEASLINVYKAIHNDTIREILDEVYRTMKET
jgi:hypothetical protein